MPRTTISYHTRFPDLIKLGTKHHHIVLSPGFTEQGNTLFHTCEGRSFQRDTVTRIDEISIFIRPDAPHPNHLAIGPIKLPPRTAAELARNEGFMTLRDFFLHFKRQFGPGQHHGQLIHWKADPTDYPDLATEHHHDHITS